MRPPGPASASACICMRALSSRYTLRPTARGRVCAERLRQRPSKRWRAHEEIGAPLHVANLEVRQAFTDERRHVKQRAHLDARDAEGHDGGRMVMHDGHYVGPGFIDLAVDEALDDGFSP